MALTRDKIALLAEDERADLDLLRSKVGDPVKDKNGSASNSLAGSLRFLAVADFILNKNVLAFREQLSEAVKLRLRLFERFNAGDPISPSYVSMLAYKSMLNALAADNKAFAESLARQMGGREAIEAEYDRPFDRSFGYCLKSILLKDPVAAERAVKELEQSCKQVENLDFNGYARALRSLIEGKPELLPQAFDEILAGHERQSKGAGLFKDTEDEVLCVWGVGFANLVRWHGLPAPSANPLIPRELTQ